MQHVCASNGPVAALDYFLRQVSFDYLPAGVVGPSHCHHWSSYSTQDSHFVRGLVWRAGGAIEVQQGSQFVQCFALPNSICICPKFWFSEPTSSALLLIRVWVCQMPPSLALRHAALTSKSHVRQALRESESLDFKLTYGPPKLRM